MQEEEMMMFRPGSSGGLQCVLPFELLNIKSVFGDLTRRTPQSGSCLVEARTAAISQSCAIADYPLEARPSNESVACHLESQPTTKEGNPPLKRSFEDQRDRGRGSMSAVGRQGAHRSKRQKKILVFVRDQSSSRRRVTQRGLNDEDLNRVWSSVW
jgi:hypothetical protein